MSLRDFFIITTWWGKIIGAFFGYLIAGPTGAIFGLLVGNFFDRGLYNYFSNPHWLYYTEKRRAIQKIFSKLPFSYGTFSQGRWPGFRTGTGHGTFIYG